MHNPRSYHEAQKTHVPRLQKADSALPVFLHIFASSLDRLELHIARLMKSNP